MHNIIMLRINPIIITYELLINYSKKSQSKFTVHGLSILLITNLTIVKSFSNIKSNKAY